MTKFQDSEVIDLCLSLTLANSWTGTDGAWNDKGSCDAVNPGETQAPSTGKARPICKLVEQRISF